jgi:hypothetical protein
MARTSSPCHFWCFSFFASGSELCKAQETRGSKFTREFGKNSTVYCFVASGNKVQLHSQENEIYLTFSKSYSSRDSFFIMQFYFFTKTIDIKSALGIIMQIEKILLNIS